MHVNKEGGDKIKMGIGKSASDKLGYQCGVLLCYTVLSMCMKFRDNLHHLYHLIPISIHTHLLCIICLLEYH